MSEFWAIVLGSALATFGGIISTLFTEFLGKRKEKAELKRAVYEDLMNNLNFVSSSDSISPKEFNSFKDKVVSVKSRIYLYGSDEIKEAYNDFVKISMTFDVANKDSKNALTGMIEIIAAQMRKELGFNDKTSKQIAKKYKKHIQSKNGK